MKEKIVQLMKSEGLTSSRLAELLEIQPSGISHIVSGRNNPRFDLLQKILKRFPKINPDWLLLDSSQMYRDQSTPLSGELNSESAADSLPVDLFGFGDVAMEKSGSIQHPKMGENSPYFSPQNHGGNGAQFGVQFGVENGGENSPQNSPQNRGKIALDSPLSTAPVQRIIILYADGTFTTYNAR